MKIKVEIDLTPEEFRAALGLPDLRPAQEEMMAALRKRVAEGGLDLDPAGLMRTLFGPSTQMLEAMQSLLWRAGGAKGTSPKPDQDA